MKVLLTGATGMVGQGVLQQCLASPQVTEVVAPVREMPAVRHPKLRPVVHPNFADWSDATSLLTDVDACFFCLGISSVGKREPEYRHVTYDLTLSLAEALLKASPQACFVFVSGQGTNAASKTMWSRVKGETENALLALPFRDVYCFRPGMIEAAPGVRSKVKLYDAMYSVLKWLIPLFRKLAPGFVTSTWEVGRAMIRVSEQGWPEKVLENKSINAAGAKAA
jgi:uncharacterized protein YbjT (DUF2867 family)